MGGVLTQLETREIPPALAIVPFAWMVCSHVIFLYIFSPRMGRAVWPRRLLPPFLLPAHFRNDWQGILFIRLAIPRDGSDRGPVGFGRNQASWDTLSRGEEGRGGKAVALVRGPMGGPTGRLSGDRWSRGGHSGCRVPCAHDGQEASVSR